ncbi:MAG: hypothetical protein ACXWE3_12125 [Methylobacter sp.]
MNWVAQRFHIVLETVLRSDNAKGFQLLPRAGWLKEPSPDFIVTVD